MLVVTFRLILNNRSTVFDVNILLLSPSLSPSLGPPSLPPSVSRVCLPLSLEEVSVELMVVLVYLI